MSKKPTDLATMVQAIQNSAKKYYDTGDSPLTDREFDELVERVRAIDPNHPVLKSIGSRVSSVSNWPKTRHIIPMGSLLKVTSEEQLETWVKRHTNNKTFCVSEKLDGSSIELVYDNGKFIQAITRGDGETGEDITPNALLMNFPKEIPFYGVVYVRGEIILKISTWKSHFPEDKNPRNSAAGVARRKHSNQECKYLNIMAHNIFGEGLTVNSQYEKFLQLRNLGFDTPAFHEFKSFREIQLCYQEYVDHLRAALDYEIDGLVISENDLVRLQEEGEVDHRPKAQRAYKFPSIDAQTVLLDIIRQTGRTGVITPVAIVEPVPIGGVVIERVSLINFAEIKKLGVGMGSSVTVRRQNDIIPRIVEATSGDYVPETTCPVCHANILWDGVDDSGHYIRQICPNINCPAQKMHRILNYLETIGVLGFGDKLVTKLMDLNKLDSPADLYTLTVEDIAAIPGCGTKLGEKLLNQIHSNKELSLPKFIKALGIRGFSESFAELVVAQYPTLDELQTLTREQLISIKGIGPALAEFFLQGMTDSRGLISSLLCHITIEGTKKPSTTKVIPVCFTGCRPTPQLKTAMESQGYKEVTGVSTTTLLLVVKDLSKASSKLAKAQTYNIKTVELSDFEKWFEK